MRGKPELIQLRDGSGNLKSPYWYIRYYDGRSQRISTGCLIGAQDHEANVALAAFTLERERPTAREPDKLMVAQALKDYYDEHLQFAACSPNAKYHEARLKKEFGNRFIIHITQASINAYVRKCQERKESNGYIRRDLEHLRAAINHEIREQRLLYAPKFRLPPPPAPRERTLSKGELKKLLAKCKSEHLKAFVQIMMNTGQRPGAVENLTWFQVDFKERIIHFERTGKPSTNKRARPIYINHDLMVILKKLHKKKKTEYVLEYKGEHAGNVKHSFARAVDRAKLEGVSRYTLRHTFANSLDADDKTIADIMGHTTVKTTQTHYIKSSMAKQREALERNKKSAQKVRKRGKHK